LPDLEEDQDNLDKVELDKTKGDKVDDDKTEEVKVDDDKTTDGKVDNDKVEDEQPLKKRFKRKQASSEKESPLRPTRASKASSNKINSRYYKPEHTQMLIECYDRSNKYPSKEDMNDLAKIIGVLPIKILWWFTHRRRQERKKGEDFDKSSKDIQDEAAELEQIEFAQVKEVTVKPVADLKFRKCLECSDLINSKRSVITQHLKEVHDIKFYCCKACKLLFRTCDFKKHQCQDFLNRSKHEASECSVVTPTKQPAKPVDKSTKPAVFYSRRYKNLLQEFSPKKPGNANVDLSELMQKTSVLRNGKFEPNFVTPIQLKAVE